MMQSIGTAPAGSTAQEGAGSAGLRAQLSRLQKMLAECVNCESAKTAPGKAQIEALSLRIGEIRERLDRVAGVGAAQQAGTPATSTAREPERRTTAVDDAQTSPEILDTPTARRSVSGTIGSLIDVHA